MLRETNEILNDIGYMVKHGMLHLGQRRLQAATAWTKRRAVAARTELLRLVAEVEQQDAVDLARLKATVPVVAALDKDKSATVSKKQADRVLGSLKP